MKLRCHTAATPNPFPDAVRVVCVGCPSMSPSHLGSKRALVGRPCEKSLRNA